MKKLPYEKLTVYEVEDMKKDLLTLLNSAKSELTLEMSEVEKLDMAAIQLLLSAAKSAKEQSCEFKLVNLNEQNIEALKKCNCLALLGVEDGE